MDIPSKADFDKLEAKVDALIMSMAGLHEDKTKILTSDDMLVRMRVSYRTFLRMKPAMCKAGMTKIGGGWKMKETDFEKYLKAHH